jgi:hypothetical protein
MNRFELQLGTELQKEHPNLQLVQQLDYIIKNGAITLAEWVSFNLVQSKDDFMKDNTDATLNEDCVDVISYLGGYYLQKLSSETFYINDNIPSIDSIDIAQRELWDLCAEELWVDEK